MNIKKLLKKYPKLYLYYHDRQEWVLYKEKPPANTYVGEPEHDAFILVEGDDYSSQDGYVPSIVKDLCKVLGIKVDSV